MRLGRDEVFDFGVLDNYVIRVVYLLDLVIYKVSYVWK